MELMQIILQWIIIGQFSVPLHAGIYEKRLLAHLFNQSRWDAHNPIERPTPVEGKPVEVFLKCFLNQIMDMDEKNQVLSTIIWLDLKWHDYHFVWNKSEYANINQINVPPTKLWKPDIILYNSANENFDQIFPTNVIIRHDGQITWIPPGLFHSTCSIEVALFPFDAQNCTLKLGTWTYQGNTVDLKLQCDEETGEMQDCNIMNEVDLSTYLSHSEWALESATVRRNADTYGGVDQTFIDVTIEVHMQRRALYYMFNIIVPCMIMSVMSLLVFTLPPDANEKIVLGVTTLLSLTMLLQLVGDKLPQTSAGNPILVLYFTCTIVLCSLSLVFAVVLLNCHHHRGGIVHAPWVITTFVNVWLASALRIDRKRDENEEQNDSPSGDRFGFTGRRPKRPSISPTLSKYWLNYPDQIMLNSSEIGFVIPHKMPTWSNIIDVDSEFRPTLLLSSEHSAKEMSPQNHIGVNPNHIELRAMIKQNMYSGVSPTRGSAVQKPPQGIWGSSRLDMAARRRFEYSCASETRPTGLRKAPQSIIKANNMFNQVSWSLSSSPNKATGIRPMRSRDLNDAHNQLSNDSNSSSTPTQMPLPLVSQGRKQNQSPMGFCAKVDTDEQLREFFEKARILRKLKELTRELRYITSRMHREDKEARTSNEWKLACRVLDRLCLVVFAALNLFTSLGILTSAPTIIKAFTCTGEPSKPM